MTHTHRDFDFLSPELTGADGMRFQVWRKAARESERYKDRKSARQKIERLVAKYGCLTMSEYCKCAAEMRAGLVETRRELEAAARGSEDVSELAEIYAEEDALYHRLIGSPMAVAYAEFDPAARFEPVERLVVAPTELDLHAAVTVQTGEMPLSE